MRPFPAQARSIAGKIRLMHRKFHNLTIRLWLRNIWLGVMICLCAPGLSGPAAAQAGAGAGNANPATATAAGSAAPSVQSAAARDAQTARQISALTEGTLDPAIDAAELFSFDLLGSSAARTRAVIRLVSDDDFFALASDDPSALDPLPRSSAQLALQQAGFLRLPKAQRDDILSGHRQKAEAARSRAQQQDRQSARIAALQAELAGLQDFLAGQPSSLTSLEIELLDGAGGATLSSRLSAMSADRGAQEDAPAADAPGPNASAQDRMRWLQSQIDAAKMRILNLPPDELRELLQSSGMSTGVAAGIADADAALQQVRSRLNAAEIEAAQARDEQTRVLTAENARLLSVESAQAQRRADLARMRADVSVITDNTLGWRRRVDELIANDATTPADIDRMYGELVTALSQTRADLGQALDEGYNFTTQGIIPAPIDPVLEAQLADSQNLGQRYEGLLREADLIREEFIRILWERRGALHGGMILMNEGRLAMIPLLSASKKSQILGFGDQGIAQAGREVDQIALNTYFYVKNWRSLLDETLGPFLHPTPRFVFELFWIVLLVLAFRYWRRHGDIVLGRMYRSLDGKRPRSFSIVLRMRLVDYMRRVRRAFDWLVFALLLNWLWPTELPLVGDNLLWLVVLWSLVTVLLLRLANELAKGDAAKDPRATLRWNSLRLVGGAILAVGLVLRLSDELVGEGTIYSWVSSLAWLLVPVIALILAHWWRERITALAASEASKSAFMAWVSREPGGIAGMLARVLAGALVLLEGAKAAINRRLSDLTLVKELFEVRARAAAARQVAEDKASGRYHDLPAEVQAALNPHRPPAREAGQRTWPGGLVVENIRPGTIAAILGERGLGKSALLHDLVSQAQGYETVIPVTVGGSGGGFDEVAAALGSQLGLAEGGYDEEAIGAALKASGKPCLIAIDDIQRLIVPAIGGLSDFDRLINIAKASGPHCAWIFTIDLAAWDYLSRARSDRIIFDTVIRLPVWPLEDLRALIERRTQQAGIKPDFTTLADAGAITYGADLTVLERKKLGYFERLSDYAEGNPAVALEYWRRSLFMTQGEDRITVRTFDAPDTARAMTLPRTAPYVLRTIMQMEIADVSAIASSTDYPAIEITDALRGLERMGVVAQAGGGYKVSLYWWLEVTRLLARQNLIVRKP